MKILQGYTKNHKPVALLFEEEVIEGNPQTTVLRLYSTDRNFKAVRATMKEQKITPSFTKLFSTQEEFRLALEKELKVLV